MQRERILVTVKTYPTLSKSHIELVCTAGFREDGSWVRIYPIPFRLLNEDHQFTKWTWVELPLVKRSKDKRPESFSPADRDDIQVQEALSTHDNWRERKRILYRKTMPRANLTDLIEAGKRNEISLATFKPTQMVALEIKKTEANWNESKLAWVEAQLRQGDLLDSQSIRENFKPANKLPYDFSYRFRDEAGREACLRILDWEIGMLFWNCLKSSRSEEEALEKVRAKYEHEFFAKDIHLLLGTTLEWHDRAPNPWVVIGVVPLPHQHQQELFSEF